MWSSLNISICATDGLFWQKHQAAKDHNSNWHCFMFILWAYRSNAFAHSDPWQLWRWSSVPWNSAACKGGSPSGPGNVMNEQCGMFALRSSVRYEKWCYYSQTATVKPAIVAWIILPVLSMATQALYYALLRMYVKADPTGLVCSIMKPFFFSSFNLQLFSIVSITTRNWNFIIRIIWHESTQRFSEYSKMKLESLCVESKTILRFLR